MWRNQHKGSEIKRGYAKSENNTVGESATRNDQFEKMLSRLACFVRYMIRTAGVDVNVTRIEPFLESQLCLTDHQNGLQPHLIRRSAPTR